ncbi:FERM domain-containing protein 3 isoform X1 [Chironomus tepperi]|uniref:FERM domain-containing protein 3 isoform X1 n=2 Tax=Chironomus tepperi TaxID=113505 RepID=UPI00391FB88D
MFKGRGEGNVVYKCSIRLFGDSEILELEFQPHHKGLFLLDLICEQLDIQEKDYFGLRFVDLLKQRHWLDLSKSLIKQVKDLSPLVLSFRFHFYPADPTRLSFNGKCMLFQQLKRDLIHGRLYCSAGEAAALGALIVQDELGDYDREIHQENYVSNLKLALRQNYELEKKIIELHRKREPGQDIVAVYDEFILIARGLETYGIDPHPVKDYRSTQLYVGINFSGISTFSVGKRIQHFRWPEISKINFEGRMFIVHLTYTVDREVKKHTVGFKCPSGMTCRYVWRCAIEQMFFFTAPNGQNPQLYTGGSFFNHSKFRYMGRTEREILSESLHSLKQSSANSSPTKRKANSVPATPSSPQEMTDIRYSSLPRSNLSEPLGQFVDNPMWNHENGIPALETVSEENRRNNPDENIEPLSDFYRESYDPEITNIDDLNMAQATFIGDGMIPIQTTAINNMTDSSLNASLKSKSLKKFSLINAFIPSFIFVILAMSISAIFILETDSEFFAPIRNWPEMDSLRFQYYEPLKEFLASKIGHIF